MYDTSSYCGGAGSARHGTHSLAVGVWPSPDGPKPTSRTTPHTPPAGVVMRPGWHRIVGWAGVALGILVVILNDAMRFGEGLKLLPSGHSELYLMLGVSMAGLSTWFLGLFERQTVYG